MQRPVTWLTEFAVTGNKNRLHGVISALVVPAFHVVAGRVAVKMNRSATRKKVMELGSAFDGEWQVFTKLLIVADTEFTCDQHEVRVITSLHVVDDVLAEGGAFDSVALGMRRAKS